MYHRRSISYGSRVLGVRMIYPSMFHEDALALYYPIDKTRLLDDVIVTTPASRDKTGNNIFKLT